jgi:Putative zinc-finger
MSGVVVPLRGQAHDAVQLLLPWHAAGTLADEDLAQVQAHLPLCPRCRADLAWERRLLAVQRQADPVPDVEQGLARMRLQIDAGVHIRELSAPWWQRIVGTRRRQQRPGAGGGWGANTPWRWALAAPLAIALLAGAWFALPLQPAEPYRALGAAARAPGQLLVMFRPDTSEQALRRVLNEAGVRVVDGPTATGLYVIAVAPEREAAALAQLRAQPIVTLAQPLHSGAAP